MKKLFYTLALAIMSLLFAGTSATANDDRSWDRHGQNFSLEGTWWLAVERPGGLPPFVSLHTYTEKGGMVGTNTSTLTTSPTHGNWVRTGHGRYTLTFYSFRLNADRQYIGTNRVTLNIRMVGPDAYRSAHQVEVFDLAGTRTDLRYDAGVGTRLPIVYSPQQP